MHRPRPAAISGIRMEVLGTIDGEAFVAMRPAPKCWAHWFETTELPSSYEWWDDIIG